jgi:hypothetical protein
LSSFTKSIPNSTSCYNSVIAAHPLFHVVTSIFAFLDDVDSSPVFSAEVLSGPGVMTAVVLELRKQNDEMPLVLFLQGFLVENLLRFFDFCFHEQTRLPVWSVILCEIQTSIFRFVDFFFKTDKPFKANPNREQKKIQN